MKQTIRIAALFCAAVCCLAAQNLPAEENEKDALLKSLRQAREDWIENASFYGHFIHRSGRFASEEEALAAELDDAGADTGFACKLKNKYRRQIILPPRDRGGETVPQATFDKIANDRFSVTSWRNAGYYLDRPEGGYIKKLSGKPGASFRDLNEVTTPWWVFTAKANLLYSQREGAEIPDCEYTKLEDGRALFKVKATLPPMEEGGSGLVLDQEVTVRTDTEEPLVERIVTFLYGEGKETPFVKQIVDILEWRECGGVPVPTRFRWVQGHIDPAVHKQLRFPPWTCWEFQFTDLGERQPTDGDFKLEVRSGDNIPPLKRIPENNIIDIDAITDDDLDLSGIPESNQK